MTETDLQLLARYTRDQSEDAFAEIVRRHIDLVFSAALRQVRSTQLAEEVAQSVFTDLARNAAKLSSGTGVPPVLTAWLYQVTRRTAIDVVRREARRQLREQIATEMNTMNAATSDWMQVEPLLDEAVSALDETDRAAVLLRYFENKSLREVGQQLGVSDDAAQKRVSRAVERLREFFSRRGITVGASGLVVVISANAVQAAPVGLAIALISASLAGAAAASGTTLTILKLMTATKLKLGVVSAVVVAAIFIVCLSQWNSNESTTQNNSTAANAAQNAMDTIAARREASMRVANRARQETNDSPVATSEEIVAAKLTKFGQSRRDLVQALAKRYGIEVPDDVKRFFDAVDRGVWEEIDAAHKVLLLSPDQLNQPRSADIHQIWRPIQEAWGAARAAHDWPAQELLNYGESVLGSLRPGMVYVGGTDPGAFIPTFLNETSESERHIVLTQNALLDGTYLGYLNHLYGDRLATLTTDDAERTIEEYKADAQKRLRHDQEFPDEPKQVRPGENVRMVDGKFEFSGQVVVMAINERMFQMLMEKNPDTSFAIEQSFPFNSTYADAIPLGPIMELRVQDEQNALTRERATESVDYWRAKAETLNAGPDATDSLNPRFAYAKMASEQAALFLDRGYTAEAEQTLRLANEIGPGSPEAFFRLLNLLVAQGRIDDALATAEATYQNLPSTERMRTHIGDTPASAMRTAIENLKRMQKTKTK